MSREVAVKVCGMTREADIEHALKLGAAYIGIIVYRKSKRCVSLERAEGLLEHIPEGKRVVVDVNAGTDDLEHYRDAGFDFFQIHADYEIGLASLAGWAGIVSPEKLWIAPRVPPLEPFPQVVLEFADTVLTDTYSKDAHGGTGKTGDWERFNTWQALYNHKRWILAGGLNPDNIIAARDETAADVLDVNSGVEMEPGVKDLQLLETLFERLRS
ncbi:MAG: phosphoribosylanthranilate isomerase [Opitutales bacterium]|nr:phosphoribosylanthranilate isomerase [Opitutales bacterium]NRA26557.1 phosphoribosylanthranilate isomerase [Opitutales bacterium]